MAANSPPLAPPNRVSSRIVQAIGIDADQFRALLRISLWIDFRGSAQAMAAGHTTDNPLKGSLILYGILSAIPAILVFVVPVEAFSRGVMTIDMIFLLMIMLVDFGVTLVVADDMRTVGWRPISSRTYLAARLANMIILISMFDLALFLVPAIWGVCQGLRVTRIKLSSAIVLAATVTVLMILAWSNGGLWVLNWALLWPTWYIVATARRDGRAA